MSTKKCTGIVIKKMATTPMLAGVGLMMVCCSSFSVASTLMGGEEDPEGGAGAGAAEETIPNVLTDPVGTPIQCTAHDVGNGVNAAIYRVEEDGVLRWYPDPAIASSWDTDWETTFKTINCIGLTKGSDMAAKP